MNPEAQDGKVRCPWPLGDSLMLDYHDREWGNPVHDERLHFEFLLLETMQAGLSWSTILRKRGNFRAAFAGFDWNEVAKFGHGKIDELMQDPGIIRYRKKIEGAIRNAVAFEEIRKEFGSFDAYIWGFPGGKPVRNSWETVKDIPVRTDLSDVVSGDMKRRGFAFVGSVTMYSHLQAIGVVNDHVKSCFRWKELHSAG